MICNLLPSLEVQPQHVSVAGATLLIDRASFEYHRQETPLRSRDVVSSAFSGYSHAC
jgi:hypothetical protein